MQKDPTTCHPTAKESLLIVSLILKEIVFQQLGSRLYQKQITEYMEVEKNNHSLDFTQANYRDIICNLFSADPDTDLQISEEKERKPIRQISFLTNQEEFIDQVKPNCQMNALNQWKHSARNSSKLYNCSKAYIIKRTGLKLNSSNLHDSSSNISIGSRSNQTANTGNSQRFSVLEREKVNSIRVKTKDKQRVYTRPSQVSKIQQQENSSPKTEVNFRKSEKIVGLNFEKFNRKEREETALANQAEKRRKDQVIILPTEEEKEQKENLNKELILNSHGQQVNSYIQFLRDRKLKLEGVMKDFDKEEKRVFKEISSSQNLTVKSRQVSSKATYTTDFQGNLIAITEPKMVNQLSLGGSPRNSDENKISIIPFKVQSCDRESKNFLQKIISVSQIVSNTNKKKILLSQNSKLKVENNFFNIGKSQISLLGSQKNIQKSEQSWSKKHNEPSLEKFKLKATSGENVEKNPYENLLVKTSKPVLKNRSKIYANKLSESSDCENRRSLEKDRKQESYRPTILKLEKEGLKQLNMKKERIRPTPNTITQDHSKESDTDGHIGKSIPKEKEQNAIENLCNNLMVGMI